MEADILLKKRSPPVKINNILKRGILIPKLTLFAFLYLGGGQWSFREYSVPVEHMGQSTSSHDIVTCGLLEKIY